MKKYKAYFPLQSSQMRKARKSRKKVATATATSSAARLTEDLICEILVKLPVKSLLRFRCVCKSWLNLIKSPNFIDMHLKYNSNSKNSESIVVVRRCIDDYTRTLVSIHSNETLDSISSPFEIPHLNFRGIEVCGPCNGLLCVSDETNIVLCNPATREFKLLPLSPCLPCTNGAEFTRTSIGFGYDYDMNDYKVVSFVHVDLGNEKHIDQIEIYNLSTNCWVEYDMKHYPEHVESASCGTLYEGSFYWIACDLSQICILSYDMSYDEFNVMPLPSRMFECDTERVIRVINDCLAILIYQLRPYEDEQLVVDVWLMHDFAVTKSITKDFKVGPLNGILEPISIWKNEALLMNSREGQLVSCALDNREVKYFDIHGDGGILAAMAYQESLVSFK